MDTPVWSYNTNIYNILGRRIHIIIVMYVKHLGILVNGWVFEKISWTLSQAGYFELLKGRGERGFLARARKIVIKSVLFAQNQWNFAHMIFRLLGTNCNHSHDIKWWHHQKKWWRHKLCYAKYVLLVTHFECMYFFFSKIFFIQKWYFWVIYYLFQLIWPKKLLNVFVKHGFFN